MFTDSFDFLQVICYIFGFRILQLECSQASLTSAPYDDATMSLRAVSIERPPHTTTEPDCLGPC